MFVRRGKPPAVVAELNLAATYLSDGMLELTDDNRDWKTATVFFERAIDYATASQKKMIWDNRALEIVMAAYLGQIQHVLGIASADANVKAIEIAKASIVFFKKHHDINRSSYKFYLLAVAVSSYYLMHLTNQARLLQEPAAIELLQAATDILTRINEKMQHETEPSYTDDDTKKLGTLYYQHAYIVHALPRIELTLEYCYHAIQAYVISKSLHAADCNKLAEIYAHLANWFQDHPIFNTASDYFAGVEVDLIDLVSHAKAYHVRADYDFRISTLMVQFLHLAKDKAAMVPDSMLKHQLMRQATPDEFAKLLENQTSPRNHVFPALIHKAATTTPIILSPKPQRKLSFSALFRTKSGGQANVDVANKNSL